MSSEFIPRSQVLLEYLLALDDAVVANQASEAEPDAEPDASKVEGDTGDAECLA